MARKPKARLNRDDWLAAGLAALATGGPRALRVDPLAETLGTTKGSFYWHFKDVGDFAGAVLHTWQDTALAAVATVSAASAPPAVRLRALIQNIASPDGPNPEPAIRAMAQTDPALAEAVREVDTARLSLLAGLLSACDVTNPDLARALYAASIGMEELSTRDGQPNAEPIGTLLDLLLALR